MLIFCTNNFANTPSSLAISIIVIVTGMIAFLVFTYLSFYQYNHDRWLPEKKKKALKFFRSKLAYVFMAIAFFFFVLIIAFLKAIIFS